MIHFFAKLLKNFILKSFKCVQCSYTDSADVQLTFRLSMNLTSVFGESENKIVM